MSAALPLCEIARLLTPRPRIRRLRTGTGRDARRSSRNPVEVHRVRLAKVVAEGQTEAAWGGLAYLPASFYIDRGGTVVLEAADANSTTDIEREIWKTLGTQRQDAR